VEPGEIEVVLAGHPAVRSAFVLAQEEPRTGSRRLVAYLLPEGAAGVEIAELRRHLRERLPDYMVPSGFVVLEAVPLTPSGKVDRRALARLEGGRAEDAYLPPRTPVEEVLAGIWRGVLRVERVGVNDNFFDLGGHSLLATQVLLRLRRTFRIDLPLSRCFECPTIVELAQAVEEAAPPGQSEKMARLFLQVKAKSNQELRAQLFEKSRGDVA
jgi:acyl carrier protein